MKEAENASLAGDCFCIAFALCLRRQVVFIVADRSERRLRRQIHKKPAVAKRPAVFLANVAAAVTLQHT
ncbi:hypothetical protein [Xanthomonas prunicola]|uniref:hypothetical protein n=1 Tax=Xanthomonas prunicola TaxID=2053930 RepID=UPI001054EB83|nr:hypothetical protein [Xanthomonas prunicola]